jgi:hypothetical protein
MTTDRTIAATAPVERCPGRTHFVFEVGVHGVTSNPDAQVEHGAHRPSKADGLDCSRNVKAVAPSNGLLAQSRVHAVSDVGVHGEDTV